MSIAATVASHPIKRRLMLVTLLSAVGGALFVPFILAGSEALEDRDLLYLWTLFPLGSAIVGALCAWGGLIVADRSGLPMPILRAWELRQPQDRSQWFGTLAFPAIGGTLFALVTVACAHAIGLPKNPGDLSTRLLTIPFAAVVTETVAHLLILSSVVLWLKNRWIAIVLSSIAFTVIFHGQSSGPPAITIFALAFNFVFSAFSGWTYTKYGFLSAVVLHAVAHGIVLGVN